MRHLLRATAAAVAVVLIGACGSSGSSISKADYIAKADAICKAGTDEIDAAAKDVTTQSDAVDFVKDTAIPNVRKQIADIQALGYPDGDKDELQSIYDSANAVLDDMEANPTKWVTSNEDPFADINKQLSDYGIKQCGS